jgi:hypothetical protein
MGNMHAEEFASMKGKNKDLGLLAHLQGNHYPPVPASMLGPSKRAISAVNRGKHDSKIKLPEGILYRGEKHAPAHAIVDQHHLHAWLKPTEDY